jgi:SlyX protein
MQSDARLIEIETRLAFQEQGLSELSDVVHRQGKELDALRRALAAAHADLDALRERTAGAPLPEPPPPHY